MKVTFRDSNHIKIATYPYELGANDLITSDSDYMIPYFYNICTDALLDGCIEYIKDDKFSDCDKRTMLKALIKHCRSE